MRMIFQSATLSAVLTAGAPASAQLLQDAPTVVIPPERPLTTARSVFQRENDVPVAERMLPAFSAQGLSLGNFELFPAVAVGGVATSNVFADDARREGDFAVVVRPEATIRTSAGPYRARAFVRSDLRRFVGNASENTEEALVGVDGSVAIGALSSVSAGVSFGSLILPRFAADSPTCAAKPLEFGDASGFAGATIEGANTRVIVRAEATRLRFGETADRCGGGDLLTKDRDRTRFGGLVRVERAVSPALSVYLAGTANRFDFRLPTPAGLNRDSSGYGVYAGVNFDLTRLIRADLRAGYINQNFKTPGVRSISGLGAQGEVLIFPNRLWTFTFRGESTVQDTGVPGTTGLLRRGGSVRADHELRRYLIATLEGGYFKDAYRGQPRRDELPFAAATVTYLSRNHWNARLGYRYLSRDSRGSVGVASFDDHRVAATLTLQY